MSPITDDPERIKLDNKIAFCLGLFGLFVEWWWFVFLVVLLVLFDLLAPTSILANSILSSGISTTLNWSQKPLHNAFPLNATENINRTRMYFRQKAPISLYIYSFEMNFDPAWLSLWRQKREQRRGGQEIYYNFEIVYQTYFVTFIYAIERSGSYWKSCWLLTCLGLIGN